MNAIDHTAATVVPDRRATGPVRGAAAVLATLAVLLGAAWAAAPLVPAPALATLRGTRLVPLGVASLLLPFAGLLGTLVVVSARGRAMQPSAFDVAGRRWLPRRRAVTPGRAARWPQVILVGGLATLAAALPWAWHRQAALPPQAAGLTLGAVAIVLAFPVLVTERVFAAILPGRLPEAAALRRLLLLPLLAWPAAGAAQVMSGLGFGTAAAAVDAAVALGLSAMGAELALRAFGRAFLPPPASPEARAAVDTLLGRLLADGIRSRSVLAPVQAHLGMDFSRSWALLFLRRASVPVAAVLALLAWSLSGVVLLPPDARAVYERFGVPVAVLPPGLHAILPWPMGRARRLEYGPVHELALGDAGAAVAPAGAEDRPPPDADRLWEGAHPAELTILVASEADGRQGFQVVSVDLRLRYRVGLSDAAALRFAYGASDPEGLLRSAAGQALARFFASRTLPEVLGENRETLGAELGAALQRTLDAAGTGLDVSGVIIEAIHPPVGAADAYHAVQAAQVIAEAAVSAERGNAFVTLSKAAQYSAGIVAQAHAAGAEAVAAATADTASFGADQLSAAAHPDSFLLDRRLTALATALAGSTLTIIDRRIPAAAAPTLDLRPMTPLTAQTAPRDGE